MTPAENHRLTAAGFTARVVGAAPDAWDRPAPCEGWRARDVVRHLVEWLPGFLQHGAGVTLPAVPSVDQNPVAAWLEHAAAVQALLEDPASAAISYTGPPGSFPLPEAVDRFYTGDVFLHTWDLARATGQDEALDAGRCSAVLAGMQQYDEALRSSGHYGPKQPVPDDADPVTRLMAFIGRRV